MTGAQERTLERLAARKDGFAVKSARGEAVRVEWEKRTPWGGTTRVRATVTPEGRVVERP